MGIIVLNNVILGAGIAGLSAAYHLRSRGSSSVVFEKDNDWGGLCGFFVINGFRFDRFVHFTFPEDEYIKNIFEKSSPTFSHPSVSSNYYHGVWLKHPAQNNLAPLSADEKAKIISDFVNRPQKDIKDIKDYETWLRVQYGNYFAENFPLIYTNKYWGVDAQDMETQWVGSRMYSPDLNQVLRGAFETQSENFYYTKFMRYPRIGGFRSILNSVRQGTDIRLNHRAVKIIPEQKKVIFENGEQVEYKRLISTLPLPEIVKIIDNVPENVRIAADKLHWTCGYMISLGFNRKDIPKYLWFYIYDKDVPAARVYSPSLKSPENVPDGKSSIQAEVFWDCKTAAPDKQKTLIDTIEKLKKICGFEEKDIIIKDIRYEPYANVTFTKNTRNDRQIILDWLKSLGIDSIGRFGKWDYLWSHQAFQSGREI